MSLFFDRSCPKVMEKRQYCVLFMQPPQIQVSILGRLYNKPLVSALEKMPLWAKRKIDKYLLFSLDFSAGKGNNVTVIYIAVIWRYQKQESVKKWKLKRFALWAVA